MLIVGDNEMASSTVSLRLRDGEDIGNQTLAQIKSRLQIEIESRLQIVKGG